MWRKALGLQRTPVEVLRSLRGRPGLVALVGEWCGGGAVVACDPVRVIGADDDPFAVLQEAPPDAAERTGGFGGGWIGLWGYQVARRVERLPEPPPRPLPLTDHWVGEYEWVLRQDRQQNWWFESLLPPAQASLVLEDLAGQLSAAAVAPAPYRFGSFRGVPGPEQHMSAVERAIEHIRAGDIFQANVCMRLEAPFEGDPLDAFCRGVQRLAPAYAAYLDTGERQVASFSPELFLRRCGADVETAPIKGTVALSVGAEALAASAKDRAENVMIVDLMRNDLGRVCQPGSIAVPVLARPEQRAGVWHLVSRVSGRVRAGVTDADLLRATFPPGSVTGAPKVRAMDVIHRLESTGREVYTGAIGYASPVAGLETSVVIRTLEFASGLAWMGVGGGVVADSDPRAELEECRTKALPVLDAVGAVLAEGRVDPATRPASREVSGALPADRTQGRRPDPRRGVFSTVLVQDGVPILADRHADRLSRSAAVLYGRRLDRDETAGLLRDAARGLLGRHRLRLSVSPQGRLDIDVCRLEPEDGPWALVATRMPGGLGEHKWLDREVLDQVVAGVRGPTREALLVEADGALLETARANLFLVLDDGVHTPAADGRILPGLARSAVLDLLGRHDIPAYEHALGVRDLAAADEVFVTNSLRGVVPVGSCEGVATWPVGETTTWLRSALQREWQESPQPQPAPRDAVLNPSTTRLLVVDNYDSFAYNLAQYAEHLGASVSVLRNDERDVIDVLAAFERSDFTHLLVSPGPGRPEAAGMSVDLVRRLAASVPVLGVCLGHQCIAVAYGARVVRAEQPVHGKPALVHHDERGVFAGIDGPFVAARYHSLVVRDVPATLEVTAWTADKTVMGLRHRSRPVEGLQVHPESILTPVGMRLVRNFLAGARASASATQSG